MRIELSPFGTYAARILALTLATAMLGGRELLALWLPLGLVLGAAFYAADFRVRTGTDEVAALEPFRALVAWPFWRTIALTTLVYALMRGVAPIVGTTYAPSPLGWIGAMTLLGMANDGLRAYGLRRIHRI